MDKKIWDNRIAPRKKNSGKYPWDFKAPSYDNRTGCSINAGNDYGVGYNQPIGSFKASSLAEGPIPQERQARPSKGYIERKDIEG